MFQNIIGKIGTNLDQITSALLKSARMYENKKDKIAIEKLSTNTDNVEISDQARASMISSSIAAAAGSKIKIERQTDDTESTKKKNKHKAKNDSETFEQSENGENFEQSMLPEKSKKSQDENINRNDTDNKNNVGNVNPTSTFQDKGIVFDIRF
jgi:hypothetical protein